MDKGKAPEPPGHTYQNISVGSNAKVHLGDSYHISRLLFASQTRYCQARSDANGVRFRRG